MALLIKEKLQDPQLAAILEPMLPLFERGFVWDQRYRDVPCRDIHYILHVAMVRCDNKEADALCAKYGQLTNTNQLCRFCHVLVEDSDDHLHQPVYKRQPQIKRMVERADKEGLKEISQHYLLNAFYKIPFHKANDRGIHGACPVDVLHTILLGLFQCVRGVFFDYVGPHSHPAKQINGLAKEYAKCFCRQSDKTIPPMRFSNGIQEGKLMGKEYRGVLLLMLVLVQSQAGRRVLRKSRKKKFKTEESMDDWALLLEMLLLMEGHLNVPEMEARDVKKLEKGMRYVMHLTRVVAQRVRGAGFKILKFHSLLHIADNIALYGVPLECDTSANESHHIPTKQAAKLTQMVHSTFNTQTANRLVDFDTIACAKCEMEDGKVPWRYYLGANEENEMVNASVMDESSQDGGSGGSNSEGAGLEVADLISDPKDAMIRVRLNDQTNKVEFIMVTRSKFKEQTKMIPQLLEFLWDLQEALHMESQGDSLRIYTRIVRGGQSFRGHPNYRGKGPWQDWAWFDFGTGFGNLPCQIHCFVAIPPLQGGRVVEFGGIRLEEGVFAVVESGKMVEKETNGQELDLLTPFLKDVVLDANGEIGLDKEGKIQERMFYLADTNAITSPCCVVPDIGGPKNGYFVVTSREEWPDVFLGWLYSIKDQDLDMKLEDSSESEDSGGGNDAKDEENGEESSMEGSD